jgi:hypothetical protein
MRLLSSRGRASKTILSGLDMKIIYLESIRKNVFKKDQNKENTPAELEREQR